MPKLRSYNLRTIQFIDYIEYWNFIFLMISERNPESVKIRKSISTHLKIWPFLKLCLQLLQETLYFDYIRHKSGYLLLLKRKLFIQINYAAEQFEGRCI